MCSNDWGYRLYFWILGPSSWDWQVVPKRRWGIATTRCVITQMCAVLLKPEIRLRVRRLVLRPTVILNTDRPLSQGRINYYARFFDTWFCFDVSLCVFMLGFAVLALLCSQGITVRIRLEDPHLCGFPHFQQTNSRTARGRNFPERCCWRFKSAGMWHSHGASSCGCFEGFKCLHLHGSAVDSSYRRQG